VQGIQTRAYANGKCVARDFPMGEVSDHLERSGCIVWVDLQGPDREQLHALSDELGLHELAVEDALSEHQRPKLDHYDTHLFLSCHSVTLNLETGDLDTVEIDAFMNERWLITVRKEDGFDFAPVLERWDRSPMLAAHGVGFLLYGLVDTIVDGYFDAVSEFDTYYDEVSEGLFNETPLEPAQQRHWFRMRRSLVHFHRLVVPMREAVSGLMRREHHTISEEMYPYFQDVYDHVLRVSESSESLRDLVSSIVETNISLREFRQNQQVKKITSWAAIVAVPTLITGFYGMNVPYPGFEKVWGVWAACVLMVVMSGGLYVIFKKRDWL
jgi:magnesium transporter